jgi:hypothetical protein
MRHRLHYADWSWREYAAAAGCLLTGRVKRGAAPQRLALAFAALYAPSTAYPRQLRPHGIGIALGLFKTLQPARKEVLVPAISARAWSAASSGPAWCRCRCAWAPT